MTNFVYNAVIMTEMVHSSDDRQYTMPQDQILIALQGGCLSRNRHFGWFAANACARLLRTHHRLRGLGHRLRHSRPEQQRIARQDGQIRVEIQGLPGNGSEIAYISEKEAQALSAHPIPAWTLTALTQALGEQ